MFPIRDDDVYYYIGERRKLEGQGGAPTGVFSGGKVYAQAAVPGQGSTARALYFAAKTESGPFRVDEV